MHKANGNRDKKRLTINNKKDNKISFVQKIMNQTKYKEQTKKYYLTNSVPFNNVTKSVILQIHFELVFMHLKRRENQNK